MKYDAVKSDKGILLISLMTLLPMSNIFIIIRLTVISILVIKILLHEAVISKDVLILFSLWSINIIIPLAMNLLIKNKLEISIVYHEVSRLVYYGLIILYLSRRNIQFDTLILISKMLLVFHISIQLAQWFGVSEINELIRNYYVLENGTTYHLELSYVSGVNFRSGSLFMNPNVYLPYPLLFLTVFLQSIIENNMKNKHIWIILALISIFLTGSRTGLVLIGLILILLILYTNKIKKVSLLFIIITIVLGFTCAINLTDKSDYRFFKIGEGIGNSIYVKLNLLYSHIESASMFDIIFGKLSSKAIMQDMEIAHIFVWYGLLGLGWYVYLLKNMYLSNSKKYPYFSSTITLLIILLGWSSSILLNISVFPFLAILVFPKIYK